MLRHTRHFSNAVCFLCYLSLFTTQEIFGDRLYIEVQRLSPEMGVHCASGTLVPQTRRAVWCDKQSSFSAALGAFAPRAVNAIRQRGLLTTVARRRNYHWRSMVQARAEMQNLPDHPEWLQQHWKSRTLHPATRAGKLSSRSAVRRRDAIPI